MYDNFNTVWSNDFCVDNQHIIDSTMPPPKGFKWFFETGGSSNAQEAVLTTLTITHKDGSKTVIDYRNHTEGFDPEDPTKARMWASYRDKNGKEHRISTEFELFSTAADLHRVSDLLQFATGNAAQDHMLNKFLANLQAYPKNYFSSYYINHHPISSGSRLNIRA